jgi:hypothetical protein
VGGVEIDRASVVAGLTALISLSRNKEVKGKINMTCESFESFEHLNGAELLIANIKGSNDRSEFAFLSDERHGDYCFTENIWEKIGEAKGIKVVCISVSQQPK